MIGSILFAVGMILEKADNGQKELLLKMVTEFLKQIDNKEDGWVASEVAMLKAGEKIKAIKARRERTGESLQDAILAAKSMYTKLGMQWYVPN